MTTETTTPYPAPPDDDNSGILSWALPALLAGPWIYGGARLVHETRTPRWYIAHGYRPGPGPAHERAVYRDITESRALLLLSMVAAMRREVQGWEGES